jgi:hypothetical protein
MKASSLKSVAVKYLARHGAVIYAFMAIRSSCENIFIQIRTARNLSARVLDKTDNFLLQCEFFVVTRLIAQPGSLLQSPA